MRSPEVQLTSFKAVARSSNDVGVTLSLAFYLVLF